MFVRKTAVQLIAAALVWCASDTFTAAEEPDGYVVRFYDVTALTVPHSGFPFTGALPGSSANNSDASGSFPIAAGGTVGVQSGGFGGGGGGGFGGGYFSLPPLAVQLGGENVDTVVANNTIRRDSHAESLMVLLTTMVEPTAWAEFGTTQGKGQCEVVGTSLVVRQTAAIQKEIREFLDKLTASVADGDSSLLLKSWWFPVAADRRQQLDALLAAKETTSRMLDGFCDETQGFRAALRCGRNRAAHTTSGIRRSFAAKTIPSVGTGAVGFTTIVGQINLGLMLEVTPMEISVGTSDEDSVSSRRPIFNVNLRSAITLPDEQGIHVRSEVTEIDRVAIGAFVVETTCRVEQGRPTIAGTLTIPPGQSWLGNGDAQREVVHVVLLTNSAE